MGEWYTMNIFDTTLGGDVKKIIDFNGSATVARHVRMEWIIYGMDAFDVPRIHSMSVVRDYRESLHDIMTAVIEVSLQDYQSIIYPNKARLFMDVYETEASERGQYITNDAMLTQYKVMLLTNEDHELFDQTQTGINLKDKSDNRYNIKIQLVEKEIYYYKDVEMSGVLGPGSIEDYVYYFMSNRGKMRCSVHPLDNTDDAENILVKEGIPLKDFANWLHREDVGLYNHGINSYYQARTMYVYPTVLLQPHDYRRRVAIFRAGSEVGIGTGNTYATIEGVLNLISSGDIPAAEGETRTIDERDMLEHMHGTSIRWNDPRYQSNVINETDDIMRYTSKGARIHGFDDVHIKIQKVHKLNTVNACAQKSIINKTQGRVITIPWQGGDIDLIEPGTEVVYHYMKGLYMETTLGIVDGAIEELLPLENNPQGGLFNIHSVLRLRII